MIAGRQLLDVSQDVLEREEFRTGLRAGLVAAVACVAFGLAARARGLGPLPIAGIAAVAAVLVALSHSVGLPTNVRNASLALVAGGAVGQLARRPVIVGALASVPGALLLADAAPARPSWASLFVGLCVILGGAAIASFDRVDDRCIGPPLLAISIAAVWVSVPDTERPLVLLGVMPVLLVTGWPFRLARIGAAGAFAVAGLLSWAAAVGGSARPSSIIAGAGALGLFAVVPLTRVIAIRDRDQLSRIPAPVLIALHAGCVVVTARLAALRSSVFVALVVAATGFTLTTVLLLGLLRRAASESVTASAPTADRSHGGTRD